MSNLFKLNIKDFLNGLFTAVLGGVTIYLLGVFAALYQLVINNQPFNIVIDWQAVLIMGVFAGLVYIEKRLFSGNTGIPLSK